MRDASDEGSLASERDFYRRLLDLGGQEEIEPLLDKALALIVEVTGAKTAYLELYDNDGVEPRFWTGHGCSDEDVGAIRASISRGIVAQAISEGRTVETPSAQGDPRFKDLASVRRLEIQAVLCAPVGTRPPIGIVYLQGRVRPGPFSAADRERAELLARQLAPLADRLVSHRPSHERIDHTREIRVRFRCPELVGHSKALAQVLQEASLVAPLDVDVLISGSSGTGKSALAMAIANNSPRMRGPFVALNCAALPETLIESELFGAERGAHSMATRRTIGKVAAAEGGTLFLDEVATLSLAAQAKLLQLLQARDYTPLGATAPVRANVRIISATNANLLAMVADRGFREDLYYRLHVLPIAMPGLAERREDIPDLVEYQCAEVCRRHKLPPMTVSSRALLACREAAWPGHVRQLAHMIEAAVIRAQGEPSRTLREHHIFPNVAPGDSAADTPVSFQDATRGFQRRHVLEALERNDWNVAETARQLELARSHLYNLINEFALKRDGEAGRPRKG